MSRSTNDARRTCLAFVFTVAFVAARSTSAIVLTENQTVFDDFDTDTPNYWILNQDGINATVWFLSKHGDPSPYGVVGLRPPAEEGGGGYIELVPLSDSPAIITSLNFELLPGASVELVYWNAMSAESIRRKTVLVVFTDLIDTGESRSVFNAKIPTMSYPDWTTVSINLTLTEPCNVSVRMDMTVKPNV